MAKIMKGRIFLEYKENEFERKKKNDIKLAMNSKLEVLISEVF